MMKQKERISPTAALVMKWAEPLYFNTGPGGDYYRHLDLSAGEPLITHCEQICPWYGEVILNRKWCLRHLVKEALRTSPAPPVLFILGAGKSPLSFELCAESPLYIDHIIEVDINGMEEKADWCASHTVHHGKISFITADITENGELRRIREAYRNRPSLILMEGISYYIAKNELEEIMQEFSTKRQKNLIFIEYCTPCRCIAPSRQTIPKEIFGYIRDISGIRIQSYTASDLNKMLKRCGGVIEQVYTMAKMERMRTGSQTCFPTPDSGWIECISAKI